MARPTERQNGKLMLTVTPTPQHLDANGVLAILADTEAGSTDQPLTAKEIVAEIRWALTFGGTNRYDFIAEKHTDWGARVRCAHTQLARVWPEMAAEADVDDMVSWNPGEGAP